MFDSCTRKFTTYLPRGLVGTLKQSADCANWRNYRIVSVNYRYDTSHHYRHVIISYMLIMKPLKYGF
jgi:hypothetical protein